ncbi:SNF8 (YPL002C) [Zygosaccharomyces parabailii]|uniref:Vacuolar-sorting protein SNF8 n=1 Tax=Zygosaccharomyces bailii (strain CLIB 213 / ATCC 58445 / CBS 680 / BCRC 21525 / NBRC 1098 / NCYC 1416 / NRRL Y-2227) TaxID=1333698 RepID=A0A8J2X9U6_ZYGB2|nr:SNF8 (YPL002C) [Zygosaccharomyces parabailii]CDF90929.1 ZYBA0S09-00936g1_1 [Zygosaccharomyces bailii CLIB 213]CDH13957.1 probable Vacuolar-sorting protein SNF8 [Zygosaccharomyces bailii ISA1307]SJM86020.1 probable Vacuolar-sorting protein SNF8 [Zygosaccharomyces bailii]
MKRFGLAAFDGQQERDYEGISSSVLQRQNNELKEQLAVFQERLVVFAKKHNSEIQANPDFRIKFIRMCSSIGIDPLSLFDKDKHLFNVNDFYYEICVKVIEICRKTKDMNGGVLSFDELEKSYFRKLKVDMKDLEKSIDMLQSLDGGFEIFQIRGKKFLRSVPNELTGDQTKILEICSILGYASISLLHANLNWKSFRSRAVLNEMVANGLLWIDEQADAEALYWDPSWINVLHE